MFYYAIYDKKAENYSTLSPGLNDKVYIRGLTSALLSNPNSMFISYPEDYAVYRICDFDDVDGYTYPADTEGDSVEPLFICEMKHVVGKMKDLLGRSEENGEEAVQNEV